MIMMILGVVVFTFLPLPLIMILVKSKRIGTVKRSFSLSL